MSASKKPALSQEQEIFRDPTQRRAWVIFQLKRRGHSLSSLAREHGVSQAAFSGALSAPNAEIEKVIADAVEVPVTDLFPERFAANGRRLHLVRGNRSSRPGAHNVHFAGAR